MYDSQNIDVALSKIENKKVAEQFNRSGFYRATVVSNIDPMRIGRIKIRIPSLHGVVPDQIGYVDDSMLPYAFPGAIQGAGFNEGQYLIPSPGHTVWVSFETGTENFIYFGSLYSIAPERDRYIYKSRTVNNGEPILAISDDIPTDYDPDRHVLFRSIFGDIIYIDDRKNEGSIVIQNKSGNKISFGTNTISVKTAEPLSAYYPYTDIYYCSNNNLSDDLTCVVNITDIYTDSELVRNVDKLYKGNLIVFINGNHIYGTGIVNSVNIDNITIKLVSRQN